MINHMQQNSNTRNIGLPDKWVIHTMESTATKWIVVSSTHAIRHTLLIIIILLGYVADPPVVSTPEQHVISFKPDCHLDIGR
jgi:hypothetical protein